MYFTVKIEHAWNRSYKGVKLMSNSLFKSYSANVSAALGVFYLYHINN